MSKARKQTVCAIVVTFNREDMLRECLGALLAQSRPCSILVVDNASSDGTREMLASSFTDERISVLSLCGNLGGAGGFAAGIARATEQRMQWMWLMDDDACPEPRALEFLMERASDAANAYGSVAIGDENGRGVLCWPVATQRDGRRVLIRDPGALQEVEHVSTLPFLGLLVHRTHVERCGLPDADFFISGDDVEYCERLARAGVRLFAVKGSRIWHPVPPTRRLVFLGREMYFRILPPWKRYYEVRNKIVIAKRYFSWRLAFQTLPGIVLRLAVSLAIERDCSKQLRAYFAGIRDGLLNRLGRYRQPGIGSEARRS